MTGKKRIAFHTLGCKLNFTESSYIASALPENMYDRVSDSCDADIYVINTCSVTADAEKKCRQAVRKFINRSPEAIIVVAGCYSQLKAQELASIPGVDIVLGTYEKFELEKHLRDVQKKTVAGIAAGEIENETTFLPSWSSSARTRTFVKIQDGCDYRCSYCTIPLARGGSRSYPIKNIVEEIVKLSKTRIPEIVLTGVNIGDFGRPEGESFLELLKEIDKIETVARIRMSSVEPDLLNDDIIDFVAGSKRIMPHFHIPLQSGCNATLGRMRRRYKRELAESRVVKIRRLMPLAGIGADIIVGFPGETDEEFNQTIRFIRDLSLSYLHIFPFSERPGTEAAEMPQKISSHVKEKRKRELMLLSGEKEKEFKRQNLGKFTEVLFESKVAVNRITGLTPNYLRAETQYNSRLEGRIARVRITGISARGNLTAESTEI